MFPSVPRDGFVLSPEVFSGVDQRQTGSQSQLIWTQSFYFAPLVSRCLETRITPFRHEKQVTQVKDSIDGICNFSGSRP